MSEESREELRSLVGAVRLLAEWDADDGLHRYLRPATAAPVPVSRTPVPVAPAPRPTALPPQASSERPSLNAVREELGDCQRCKLARAGRNTIVFGEGNPRARLVFVGEAPGFHEDRQGRPFVGAAGELLDKMIVAMGLTRADVYICNVVKCRPPDNRNPEPDEVVACQPFMLAQVRAIGPEIVVAMGKFAAQTLLNTTEAISRLRGRFHPYFDAKLMPTFHPAYLLRNPSDKRLAWQDLQAVMAELGLGRGA